MMKKYLIMLMMAVAVFVSCGQDNLLLEDETVQLTPITFNLSANHPDATKAVKTDWEAGDAIFVFFSGAAAPKHLKMTFDEAHNEWTSVEYDGAVATPGALGLKNGDTGTMRAVYLPFGSDATVSASGTNFTFNKTYYAYYQTATLDYTVSNGKVSGAFKMEIPEDYVQFFVEDAEATDEAYLLGTDAVIPIGVASIAADGTVIETSDKTYVDDMPGYVYDNGTDPKGYIFTGKLNGSYDYSGSYYFSKTKSDGTVRHDYFVTGKTIASHSAVKLPANDNVYEAKYDSPNTGKWVPVGSGITVSLFKVTGSGSWQEAILLGKWHTCNYGQSVPESLGGLYTFDEANALVDVTLPTKEQFKTMLLSSTRILLTVHGHPGFVVTCSAGFLFLPFMEYWSSTPINAKTAFHLHFDSDGAAGMFLFDRTAENAVRPFEN